MNDVDRFLPLNPREFLVLFALVDGQLHGYGLLKAVDDQSEGRVPMDPANLYRCLKRLLREGLVVTPARRRRVTPETNGVRSTPSRRWVETSSPRRRPASRASRVRRGIGS